MTTLSTSIALLQIIKKHLRQYFSMPTHSRPIRSTELYEFLKRQSDFRELVASPSVFGRFLRRMHEEGILKQVLPNVEVDKNSRSTYQWFFYPPARKRRQPSAGECSLADSRQAKDSFFAVSKNYEAANGVTVRSKQELYILNQLLQEGVFDVSYEQPLPETDGKLCPDFTICHTPTDTIFHWEHFGVLNHPRYDEYMVCKLEQYSRLGHKDIDEGGRLVVTRYENEYQFVASVGRAIAKLKKMV